MSCLNIQFGAMNSVVRFGQKAEPKQPQQSVQVKTVEQQPKQQPLQGDSVHFSGGCCG